MGSFVTESILCINRIFIHVLHFLSFDDIIITSCKFFYHANIIITLTII
nr:MAG TPA: hypothetical protein [Caudoviricetes sp.]